MANKGFTLIELTVAIFLITVGVGAAYTVIQTTTGFTAITSSQLVASYLAQEGIEIVRNMRDTNWLTKTDWDFMLTEGTYYYDLSTVSSNSNVVIYDYPILGKRYMNHSEFSCGFLAECQDTRFSRRIVIERPEGDVMNVESIVEWDERGRSHEARVQTKLYNWK